MTKIKPESPTPFYPYPDRVIPRSTLNIPMPAGAKRPRPAPESIEAAAPSPEAKSPPP